MKFKSFVATDVGMKRKANEDNFSSDSALGIFVVADGMGGHAAGEVASRIAVEEILGVLSQRVDDDWTWPDHFDPSLSLEANRLRLAINIANEKIRGTTLERAECRGMGTTVVATMLEDNHCCIAHVGDSRAYLFRGDNLELLTCDHSWVNDQLRQGLLTIEHVRNHPFRNVITQALGSGPDPRIDILELDLENKDLLILCSDGLNSMLTDGEIQQVVRDNIQNTLDTLTLELIGAANRKGGDDNITVAAIEIQG